MSKVLLDICVSLDRFVAGPDGEDGAPRLVLLARAFSETTFS